MILQLHLNSLLHDFDKSASAYDCVRLELFKGLNHFVVLMWILVALLSRVKPGHLRRFRNVSTRRMAIPVCASLGLAAITSCFMQPHVCTCTSGGPNTTGDTQQIIPFCHKGLSSFGAIGSLIDRVGKAKSSRFWMADVNPTPQTTCDNTLLDTKAASNSKECGHEADPVASEPEGSHHRSNRGPLLQKMFLSAV